LLVAELFVDAAELFVDAAELFVLVCGLTLPD